MSELQQERLNRAIELSNLATELDRSGKYEEALDAYRKSLQLWLRTIECETNQASISLMKKKVEEYLTRAEELKQFLRGKTLSRESIPSPKAAAPPQKQKSSESEDSRLKKGLESAIVREKPNVPWEAVAGLEHAKESLRETVILPTKFPALFTGNRKPWKGILLYGPPGTGKSYLAKACATEACATFFSVSSSDLVSKWMGESEKLVKTLFDMARDEKFSIIFIDEIDSLCSSRKSGDSEAGRRIKTEFLVQMDGVSASGQAGQVLVLAATNTPWDLDPALRRRFERRIYIPLPDPDARFTMLKLGIGETPSTLNDDQLNKIAKRTNDFSGSDISVLVRDVLMQPVRRCSTATHFKKIEVDGEECFTPCSSYDSNPTKIQTRLMDIDPDKLFAGYVTMEDFIECINSAKPSVNQSEIGKYTEWTENYGMEG